VKKGEVQPYRLKQKQPSKKTDFSMEEATEDIKFNPSKMLELSRRLKKDVREQRKKGGRTDKRRMYLL
jgi:hypothetical protein